MTGCPEALAWDDAAIYTCFWCIWCVWPVFGHSANDWLILGKKGVAADLAVQCNCCLFSAQLCLLLCPSMHVATDGYLEGAPINCKELL